MHRTALSVMFILRSHARASAFSRYDGYIPRVRWVNGSCCCLKGRKNNHNMRAARAIIIAALFFELTVVEFAEAFASFSTLKTPLYRTASNVALNAVSTSRAARDLMTSLITEEECFTTESGARAMGDVCATNVVYEDCFEPQPIVGKTPVTNHLLQKVAQRQGKGGFRMDKISDGSKACGFAWTWTSGDEEGLRGTTFVELNANGEIEYLREIPEPIYKPGDLTVQLLKAVTEGAEPKPPVEYETRDPTTASDMVKYLFNEVQGSSVDESMRCFDESIKYRDFNYEEILVGKDEVRQFIEDFNFPGIEFRTERIDDGIDSCCFTWKVLLDGVPEDQAIKGISFYELEPETRKVRYVRDVPESAIKPPILGSLARKWRPGLGVFSGVKLGSREGGL